MYAKTVLEDKRRRDIYAQQEEVLDNFKPAMTIPGTDLITFRQAADYLGVGYSALSRCYDRHMAEFAEDGVDWYTPITFRNLASKDYPIKNVTNFVGRALVEFNNGYAIVIPNRGIRMMHKRTLIRFAFLLKDSVVASEIRSLFAESDTKNQNESVHTERGDSNELMKSLIVMVTSNDISARLKAVEDVVGIYNELRYAKGKGAYELGKLY